MNKIRIKNWDEYFIKLAMLVSEKSKDPSTQVGCVIIGPDNEIRSTGFNGFPRGVNELDDTRWERPVKYEWVEHAERNAVFNAAHIGIQLKGCRAYLNWEPRPCVECCKGFIQAGIIEVIGPDIPFPSGGSRKDWKFEVSTIMMNEANITYRTVEWKDVKETHD